MNFNDKNMCDMVGLKAQTLAEQRNFQNIS
jgi:hypothetical protein